MKFLNKETQSIIEVDKKDKLRIEKLKGYPDKFEIIEEYKEEKKNKNQFKMKENENDNDDLTPTDPESENEGQKENENGGNENQPTGEPPVEPETKGKNK